MFARVRRPRLVALLLAGAGTVAAVVYCYSSRPNDDGLGRVVFCSAPLFFVLYAVLWNAGLRFGVWFRQAPESRPVFVRTQRHPLVVLLLLWSMLAMLVGILVFGFFGPEGQSWALQRLYDDVPATPVPPRAGSAIVYLLPVDDFPPAAASRLADRLNGPDGPGISFRVLPVFGSGLLPSGKDKFVSANDLSHRMLEDYPARVSRAPGEKPPYLIWLIDRPLYSEDENQEVWTWHPGGPVVIVAATVCTHQLSADAAKARETFESRLVKVIKRAIWIGLLERPFQSGKRNIFGERHQSMEDLDARPDAPLPWY